MSAPRRAAIARTLRFTLFLLLAGGLSAFVISGGALAGGWTITVVDSAGNVGQDSSLDFDSAGNPHISYYDDSSNKDLKYATMDGDGWHITTVDSYNKVGEDTSIDASGGVSISYYDETNRDLRFAHQVGSGGNCGSGAWQCEVADNGGGSAGTSKTDVGENTSLALDPSGNARISYYDDTHDDLRFATFVGDGNGNCGGPAQRWQCLAVDTGGRVGKYSSLALDSSGLAHISYYDETNGTLKYARQVGSGGNCGGGAWQCEVVTGGVGDEGEFTSIALSADGSPRIAFEANAQTTLKYACWNGTSWDIENIASGARLEHASLRIGSVDGLPRVSYHDETATSSGLLAYAVRTAICGQDGAWQTEVVDSSVPNVGEDNSLALKADDTPCISYYDKTNGDLRYACMSAATPLAVTYTGPTGVVSTSGPTVTGVVADPVPPAGLSGAQLSLNGGPATPCQLSGTDVSCPTSGLADGHYDAVITVTANDGQTASDSGSFDIVACHTGKPVLALVCPTRADVSWASYVDYSLRILTVSYGIRNDGSDTAHAVTITSGLASNGVVAVTAMPAAVGEIPAGSQVAVTIRYQVPQGTAAFTSYIRAASQDGCGHSYTYPA